MILENPGAKGNLHRDFCAIWQEKGILRFDRISWKLFVIFSEFVLDKLAYKWYYNQACVGKLCARTAMKREIAS